MVPPLPNLARIVNAFERIPHVKLLGMRLAAIEPGKAKAVLPYHNRLIGNPKTGVVHGGVITALLDTLAGIVVMSLVEDDVAIATLDLRIDYLRPAVPGQEIRGWMECYKITQAIAFVRGMAYHRHLEDPIAHAAGSFMLGATGFSAPSATPDAGAAC